MPSTVDALLQRSTRALADALGLPPSEARLEAQVLLGHALGKPRAWLLAHGDDTLPEPGEFTQLLERRLLGEPVAYLLGEREFFGLPFAVSPAVLVPRPETELLVELALERLPEDEPVRVLDLGTGSGIVAVTIARHRPRAEVVAVDRSEAALQVATLNAAQLNTPNVRFLQSDWYSALGRETFDLIASNPPYVAEGDPHLSRGDLRFEPGIALACGPDGLSAIRTIVAGALERLNSNGWLMFEHGYDQSQACLDLLRRQGFKDVFARADLAGIPRVAGARK